MLTSYIKQVLEGRTLSMQEARQAAEHLLHPDTNGFQTAALLALLAQRGETAEEIAGMASALLEASVSVSIDTPTIDIVGTGGDGANTVNISTGAALLTAACGVPVVKHGNRSSSGRCGSADVLEALGVNIAHSPQAAKRCLEKAGMAFLFAPTYHPVLKDISPIRRGMKIPTIFNLLGPLVNPARVPVALVGVARKPLLPLMGHALNMLGHVKRALVFHGHGVDELTPIGPIDAIEITHGKCTPITVDALKYGIPRCTLQDLQGADAATNAALLSDALKGTHGPLADTLILNAGLALYIYGAVTTHEEGMGQAKSTLQSGLAYEQLKKLIIATNREDIGHGL